MPPEEQLDYNAPEQKFDNLEVQPVPQYDAFVLDSKEKADWVLKKLAGWDAEYELVERQMLEILERITQKRLNFEERFMEELKQYSSSLLPETEGKTICLPHGKIQFRTVPQSYKVEITVDELKKSMPYFIRTVTTETVDKAEYLKTAKLELKNTGELLPGITVTPTYEKFDIKFN